MDNTELFGGIIIIFMNILNFITQHYSKAGGVRKWILFIAEMISVTTSKDTDQKIKLPLRSVPPVEEDEYGE